MKEQLPIDEYYDNNVSQVMNTPWQMFRQISFKDMMERCSSWDGDLDGIILRVEDPKTGLISESHFDDIRKYKRTYKTLLQTHNLTSFDSESMYTNYVSTDSE